MHSPMSSLCDLRIPLSRENTLASATRISVVINSLNRSYTGGSAWTSETIFVPSKYSQ